ncbi:MAG: hypothetical protein VB144_01395 [Clostridia bacterium]|nr:hypothetical protein [Clostridia bacterium]
MRDALTSTMMRSITSPRKLPVAAVSGWARLGPYDVVNVGQEQLTLVLVWIAANDSRFSTGHVDQGREGSQERI